MDKNTKAFVVRLPTEMHDRLKHLAIAQHSNLNKLGTEMVVMYLDQIQQTTINSNENSNTSNTN
jgi:predicted DNA-binding protein